MRGASPLAPRLLACVREAGGARSVLRVLNARRHARAGGLTGPAGGWTCKGGLWAARGRGRVAWRRWVQPEQARAVPRRSLVV